MGRPLFSPAFLRAQEALQHSRADTTNDESNCMAAQIPDTLPREQAYPRVDETEDGQPEIEEKFLDPTSSDGLKIKVRGLTTDRSPLARSLIEKLPHAVLVQATAFDESLDEQTGVLSVSVKYKNETIGMCSIRVADAVDEEQTETLLVA